MNAPLSSIIVQPGALNQLHIYIPELSNYSQLVIISHVKLLDIYGNQLRSSLQLFGRPIIELTIPAGEQSKNISQVTSCWKAMLRRKVDRKAAVIALGGGVVSDLAGFAASCYMRGLDFFFLPTTLMAMIDAAIGGKNGVNFPSAKNAVGTFTLPKRVVIDTDFLQTLPPRELNSGIAEIIKYGMICDPVLFHDLEKNMDSFKNLETPFLKTIIQCCAAHKQRIVAEDFKDEKGVRALLNYGHTFAHAIESATRYRRFTHGEAVAIGMSCAASVSLKLNLCPSSTAERQEALLIRAGLPVELPRLSINRLIELMKNDKKSFEGKISLILPQEIGKVVKVSDVDPLLIKQILKIKSRH